ncbi:Mitochondrial amidoxime reducing component 2 [Desmophyllum pertusum]|uniref:Mitochondrial amidoxime reducing component 2 n=1 Tax=Desmophyllum pertusum TaxID=174260 RepID=A0A9W9YSQ0_9CNID|nr:Mitochondrial amidoxime reducing component 2 [Desmophyllum pertusum]
MVSYSKYLLIGLPVVALAGFAALWWQRQGRTRSFKEVGRVSGLFFYPVKSCKGIRVDDVQCFKEGMEFDRHWCVLDGKDIFASQRKDPKLALVVPHFEEGKYLCLDALGMEMLKLDIHLQVDEKEYKKIKIFGMEGEGQYVGDEAAEWFSSYLNKTWLQNVPAL